MSKSHTVSRREFLRASGRVAIGVGAGLALPNIFLNRTRAVTGQNPAEFIRVGFIGTGGRGLQNMGGLAKNIVAVCDVDKKHLAAGKAKAEEFSGRACAAFSDYRKLLEDPTIDAVCISTPDHWHVLAAADACEAGKDVYCEKPLTLTVAEGRALVKIVRRTGRILQTGSQQRSDPKFRKGCEYVRNGRLGKIHTVRVGLPSVNFSGPPVPDSEPPPELDYDFWLGPAPWRPYNEKRVHYLFRFFWDYSGGQMTNFGAHHLDIAQWALGMDESGPVSVEAKARFHPQHWYEVPEWFEATYEYANGVKLLCVQNDRPGQDNQRTPTYRPGVEFQGEHGTLFVGRGALDADPPELLERPIGAADVRLYPSDNHYQNWLDCIKTRQRPICDVAIGHRSATVCHLGNIAIRAGRKIRWDPVKEEIIGDPPAARMLSRPYRAPWKPPRA
jgi:predicted dehydrogenase